MIDNAELTRVVSELTRDVERFDSILNIQRQLLQHGPQNEEKAERQWKKIGASVGKITTKTREILDEIGQPVADG